MKLSKSESMATELFKKKLRGGDTILKVIAEKVSLALLPESCVGHWRSPVLRTSRSVLPCGCTEICLLRLRPNRNGNSDSLKINSTICALTRITFVQRPPQSKFDCRLKKPNGSIADAVARTRKRRFEKRNHKKEHVI